MTQRQLDEIEVKREAYDTERKESIGSAFSIVEIDGDTTLFHATTYARNMLVAKILVCEENEEIQYITLYGKEIKVSKNTGKKILRSIVDKQDEIWGRYFFLVRSLYVNS